MLTTNPFSELYTSIPPIAMQVYVVVMFLLVVAGTIFDVMHKKSAKYFFEVGERFKSARTREVGEGEKVGLAVATLANEVITSSEFCNPRRRLAHLLTMYGFVLFLISTAVMVFGYSAADAVTPTIWPFLWHIGALMVMVGGYWFWFKIRVDVSAEGHQWHQFYPRADMFILSLLATTTFAIIWSWVQLGGVGVWSMIFFALFILSATILFGGIPWSKFAHMFFKPAAAFQKRVTKADGTRENLPDDYDLTDPAVQAKFPDIPEYMGKNPPNMGLGIKREAPRHY
jgi:hypothetical protein